MLIAIAGLVLVVVYLASKPMPGDQQGTSVPPNTNIPATGTSGVPSPATWIRPLMGTNAGQLVLQTNAPFVGQAGAAPSSPPVQPSITSQPLGPPSQSKDLSTAVTRSTLMQATVSSGGGKWVKL